MFDLNFSKTFELIKYKHSWDDFLACEDKTGSSNIIWDYFFFSVTLFPVFFFKN